MRETRIPWDEILVLKYKGMEDHFLDPFAGSHLMGTNITEGKERTHLSVSTASRISTGFAFGDLSAP